MLRPLFAELQSVVRCFFRSCNLQGVKTVHWQIEECRRWLLSFMLQQLSL